MALAGLAQKPTSLNRNTARLSKAYLGERIVELDCIAWLDPFELGNRDTRQKVYKVVVIHEVKGVGEW